MVEFFYHGHEHQESESRAISGGAGPHHRRVQDRGDPSRVRGAQGKNRSPRPVGKAADGPSPRFPRERDLVQHPAKTPGPSGHQEGTGDDPRISAGRRLIIDRSAILSIFLRETGSEELLSAILGADFAGIGAPTAAE